jgi:hypothetical protein
MSLPPVRTQCKVTLCEPESRPLPSTVSVGLDLGCPSFQNLFLRHLLYVFLLEQPNGKDTGRWFAYQSSFMPRSKFRSSEFCNLSGKTLSKWTLVGTGLWTLWNKPFLFHLFSTEFHCSPNNQLMWRWGQVEWLKQSSTYLPILKLWVHTQNCQKHD